MTNSIHVNTTLGAVHLTVSDLKLSIEFYQNIIGLIVRENQDGVAYLGSGENDLVILYEDEQAKQIPNTSGLYHFALLTPSRLELARAIQRVIDSKTPVQGFADHLVSEAIYLPDPDGNGIEIYRDRPRQDWPRINGELQMATDPIDLEGVLAELEGQQTGSGLMDRQTTMGHMHLHVGDLDEAKLFYDQSIGFDFVMGYGKSAAFLSAGGYHHHLGINTWAGMGAPPPPAGAIGLRCYTVILPDEKALNTTIDQMRIAETIVEERETGFFTRDPSQNGVLLTTQDK